jgi:16S rRNA (uracil1498-N3)-methyltransferase
MSMLWVWVDELTEIGSGSIELSRDEARHVTARRLRVGDSLVVFDGRGATADARIESVAQRSVRLEVDVICENPSQGSGLVIASAIPKGDRLGTMLQMLTQLGLEVWQPLVLDDSAIRKFDSSASRLQRICIESAKVARRPWRLELRETTTLDMLFEGESNFENVYYGDRVGKAFGVGLDLDGEAAVVIIGPEAGFSESERKYLEISGAMAISFGQHNLRIETAAVAAMTAANFVKAPR